MDDTKRILLMHDISHVHLGGVVFLKNVGLFMEYHILTLFNEAV